MKIWVWGTGQIAESLIKNGLTKEITGFIETRKTKDNFKGYPVICAEEISCDFDYIIVANHFVDQIYDWCIQAGFDMKKILFLVKGKKIDYKYISDKLKEILGKINYTNYQAEFGIYTDTFIEIDKKKYEEMNKRENFIISERFMKPIIQDRYALAGTVNNYFWQDLWAAKHIIADNINLHYDIGSRLDGFIAHLLAAGLDVHMIDIRPFPVEIDHLYTVTDDATMMNNIRDNSLESLSALCSLEHFGLGRYGDSINPEACFECFEQIQNKLKPEGKFYLSVPVGKERVEFNAHRVFYPSTIIECFNKLELKEYACTAQGQLEYDSDIHKYDEDIHSGEFRFGLFFFQKRADQF